MRLRQEGKGRDTLISGAALRPVKTHRLEAWATMGGWAPSTCVQGYGYFPSLASTAGQLIFWKKAWM